MNQIKSEQRLDKIAEAIRAMQFKIDEGYVGMAVTQSGGLPEKVMANLYICHAVYEIGRIRKLDPVNVMLNRVEPGAKVPVHRDWIKATPLQKFPPRIERWHLPVQTNDQCFWFDEDSGQYHMPLGFWCGPVPYWINHTVTNNGAEPRFHLIVDLDTPTPVGEYKD